MKPRSGYGRRKVPSPCHLSRTVKRIPCMQATRRRKGAQPFRHRPTPGIWHSLRTIPMRCSGTVRPTSYAFPSRQAASQVRGKPIHHRHRLLSEGSALSVTESLPGRHRRQECAGYLFRVTSGNPVRQKAFPCPRRPFPNRGWPRTRNWHLYNNKENFPTSLPQV